MGKNTYPSFNTNAIKFATLTGATTATETTLTGIVTSDQLIRCWAVVTTTQLPAETAGTITISSDGKIKSTDDESGNKLCVLWYDVSVAEGGTKNAFSELNLDALKFGTVAGSTASDQVTFAGIATGDAIVAQYGIIVASQLPTALAGTITIPAAGKIASSANDSANKLCIVYYDVSVAQNGVKGTFGEFNLNAIKVAVVDGTTSDAMTITGIATEDAILLIEGTIISTQLPTVAAGTWTITGANEVTSTEDESANTYVVTYFDKSAEQR
jgi:hypothetical protein